MTKIYFSKTTFHEKDALPGEKKMQSKYCRQIVLEAACKELGVKHDEVIFSTDANSKPYLSNSSSFYFNISHTNAAVAVAISSKPVGIDIELIKNVDENDLKEFKALKIAKKMFLPHEFEYIIEQPHKTGERFYEIWTKKEAYAKYIGTGIFGKENIMRFDVLNRNLDIQIDTLFIERWVMSVCGEAIHNLQFIAL